MSCYICIETKIGTLRIVENGHAITHVVFRAEKFPSDVTD